jgi:hypothetical protein
LRKDNDVISVKEKRAGTLGFVRQYFSCKCGKGHLWNPRSQQSPYTCFGGCGKIMIDVTKLVEEPKWRISYHQEGERAVKCGASL